MNETGDENRKDTGKAPFWLIPWEALWALADLYGKGAAKYGPNQWRDHPMAYSRNYSALQRHAWKWWGGEEYDPTDGQHHLIAVAWNAFALYTHQVVLRLTKQDDRPLSLPAARTEMHVPAAIPPVGMARGMVDLQEVNERIRDLERKGALDPRREVR